MDAAARPFPNDETTPPVTKMYLAGIPAPLVLKLCVFAWIREDVLQLICRCLATGNRQPATVFRGFCAPEDILIGLAPAGVHDLLYRNSGWKEQPQFFL